MVFGSPPPSLFGYGLLIVASIALMITSLKTYHWAKFSAANGDDRTAYCGLFQMCLSDGYCYKYSDSKLRDFDLSSRAETIALCIAAIVFYAITMVIVGHLVFFQRMVVRSRTHGYAIMLVATIAAVFAFSGVAKFTNDNNDDDSKLSKLTKSWDYDYSLYLAPVSGVFSIFAGILSILAVNTLYMKQPPLDINFQQQPGIQATTVSASPYK